MPRRQKGEGSIGLRADGRWMGSFEVESPLGRKRKYVYAPTQRACADALKKARRDYERTGSLSADLTLSDWLTMWLDGLQHDQAVRPRTLAASYRPKMGAVSALIGKVRLDKLTAEHVKSVYRQLAKDGAAKATIVQTHRILSRAIKDAYQAQRVGRNVMELVPTPKVGKAAKQTEHMSAADVYRVLKAIDGDRLMSRWLFQITLGARQSEVLGLGWEDVDFDGRRVTIRRSVQREIGKGLRFGEPKSETSHRNVALPPVLLAALQSRHERWLTEPRPDLSDRGDLAPHALVWGTPAGLPYDDKVDREAWKQLLTRAGVEGSYGTHSARHGLATLLANRNVPVKVLQGILGHADPQMTLGTYAGLEDAAQRLALEEAEAAIWSYGD